jgi:2-iminoacetate synthase ThiH
VGSILVEENVARAAGVTRASSEDQLCRMIEDAGSRPIQGDTLYHNYFLN